jgi:hypothetical protein
MPKKGFRGLLYNYFEFSKYSKYSLAKLPQFNAGIKQRVISPARLGKTGSPCSTSELEAWILPV